jgi:hypothetical protein
MNLFLKRGTHCLYPSEPQKYINIYDEFGRVYIKRNPADCINFNVVKAGYFSCPNGYIESKPLKLPEPNFMELYEAERNRGKQFEIVYNNAIGSTPARIFTNLPVAKIEVNEVFMAMPPQYKLFILLHEMGHMYYETEEKADLYALKKFLEMGYNASQAYYCLESILKQTPQSISRLKHIISQLKKADYVKDTERR